MSRSRAATGIFFGGAAIMKTGLVITALLVMVAAPCPAQAAGQTGRAAEVRAQAQRTVEVLAGTQRMRERHHDRKSRLADEIESLERDLKDAVRLRRKTEAYLDDQRSKVAELERRLAESVRIRRDLEPVLDRSLERLVAPSAESPDGLAFRSAETAALGRLLNDYDASLSTKTGRLLEVLKDQARLGGRVMVEETDLTVDGRTWRVRLIRLGRLALYALTMDSDRAWRYRPQSGDFTPLPGEAARLAKLAEMAQGRRLVELIKVPLDRRAAAGEGGER